MDAVWETKLDGRYEVRVVRTEPYHGELIITEDDAELLRKPVILSYNAIFGPDVADVADWQEAAIAFADQRKNHETG
jgi:hypothetical protein